MVPGKHQAVGKLVPWSGWEEWEAVRTGMFSASPSERTAALRQVHIWRCRGRLPLSIDATATLLELCRQDNGQHPQLRDISSTQQSFSDLQLRDQYSLAIIRLVNGISDSAQTKKVAVSVAAQAEDAGLPRMLVDVRHEASHGALPSLPLLRMAAGRALDWLQEYYWQRQADKVASNRSRITSLIKEVFAARQAAVNRGFHQAFHVPDSEEDEMNDEASQSGGTADQPKQGRSAAVELRDLTRGLQAYLVASPILDDSALPVPEKDMSRQQEQALEFVLHMLCKWVPDLPTVLLLGAVERVTGHCHRAKMPDGGASGNLKGDAQTCIAWVKYILTGPVSTKGKQAQEEGPSWRSVVTAPQVRALLALCLKAPAQSQDVTGRPPELLEVQNVLTARLMGSEKPQTAVANRAQQAQATASNALISAPDHQDGSGTSADLGDLQNAAAQELELQLKNLEEVRQRKRLKKTAEAAQPS